MFQFKKLILSIFILSVFPALSQEKVDILILNKNYTQALNEIEILIESSPSANLFLKKGMVFNLLQQYKQAAGAFFAATELDPENSNILGELAEVLTKLDNHTDAVLFFSKALSINPDDLALAGKLGSTYINIKDYNHALDVFSVLYEKDSTNVYWNKLIRLLFRKNQE